MSRLGLKMCERFLRFYSDVVDCSLLAYNAGSLGRLFRTLRREVLSSFEIIWWSSTLEGGGITYHTVTRLHVSEKFIFHINTAILIPKESISVMCERFDEFLT
jgi:hypothetical protein